MTPNHALQPTTASVLAVPSARCASAAAEGGRYAARWRYDSAVSD